MKLITIIVILLSIALLVFVGIDIYGIYQDHLQQQFTEGYNQGQFDLINHQTQQKVHLYFTNQSGQVQVQSIDLNDICGGAG